MDESKNRLLRFRAIWIMETFNSFMDKSDQVTIMMYFGKGIKE